MSTWGPGPIDNETAAEWMSETLASVHARIDDALLGDDPDQHRVAAFLLERVGFMWVYPTDEPQEDFRGLQSHLRLAVEHLESLRENEDWLSQWEDPDAAVAAIDAQLDVLRERREDLTPPRATNLLDRLETIRENNTTPKRGSDADAVGAMKRRLIRE